LGDVKQLLNIGEDTKEISDDLFLLIMHIITFFGGGTSNYWGRRQEISKILGDAKFFLMTFFAYRVCYCVFEGGTSNNWRRRREDEDMIKIIVGDMFPSVPIEVTPMSRPISNA